ncbi:zinc-dependent metalloprotease family protein [Marinicella meishanensis]|uniref:zinc-dependent metalloprotease family protein n=1 Tax=Marinicella meishanensis TaxID=2873263 RepID=UPI001CC09432|nr:zinc-dependent metalloprotease family protein [Marinicella sp. NBU2979]
MKLPLYKMVLWVTTLTWSCHALSNHELFIADEWATWDHISQADLPPTMDPERMAVGTINTEQMLQTQVGDSWTLPLPGITQKISLYVEHIDHHIHGIKTLTGIIDRFPNANFTISVEGSRALGNLRISGSSYIIEPISKSSAASHRIYRAIFPEDRKHNYLSQILPQGHDQQSKEVNFQNKNEGAKPSPTVHDVSVLFLYANNVTDANMLASNVVTKFNQVLQNSEVGFNQSHKISIAGPAQMINSDFLGDTREDIVNLMSSKSELFSDIEIRRDHVGADLVFLFVKTELGPTFERVGGAANTFFPESPYGVSTDTYALGDLTAIHEIGHMLGGIHPEDSKPDINNSLNHGLIDANNQWQTIMGGYNEDDGCVLDTSVAPEKQTCRRIEYFSNPALNPAVAGGQYIGNNHSANMKSTLELTIPQAANWGSISSPVYSEPIRGYSFDPEKNGHGLHITKAGSGDNIQYVIVFYTYDNNGEPEWMIAQTSNYQNNSLSGDFYRYTFDDNTEQTTPQDAGSFTLDYALSSVNNSSACDGVNRSAQPGVFNWTIDGQTGSWCMQPLFLDENFEPKIPNPSSVSGLWFEPTLSGWGSSFQVAPTGSTNVALATVYYFDQSGVGRWANGQLNNVPFLQSDFVFNLFNHVTGYPRTGTGSTTTQDIGTFKLLFSNGNRSYINATYPSPPGGTWLRDVGNMQGVAISRLSY